MLQRSLLGLVAIVIIGPTAGWAQPPGVQRVVSPASMVGSAERSCFVCHDNSSTVPNGPDRKTMWAMTPEALYEALTTGPMASHVSDLREVQTAEQKRALVELITGKTFGGSADRAAEAMPNRCENPLQLDMSLPQWNGTSPDATNLKFQPAEAAGLTAEQVPQLKLKWAFGIPGSYSAGHTQPTVVGGAVFTATDNNYVYALDAKTGCVHWSYNVQNLVRGSVIIGPMADTEGVRFAAYFGDYMGRVLAVNAETGEHLWTVEDGHPQAKMTAAPVLDPSGERLYVPVASWEEQTGAMVDYECCTFQGNVIAVDVKTGEKVWQTHAFPERPQPLNKTNTAGRQLYGPAGAGIWNTPTLDLKRRAVYAGTGNCNTTEHFGTQDWENSTGRVCDAVIAFDMDTGRRLWVTQLYSGDRDEGGCGRGPERRINCPSYVQGPGDDVNQTSLVNLPNGRRAVLVSQENGRTVALDPDNEGAVIWIAQAGDQSTFSVWGGATDGEVFYRPLGYRDGTGGLAAMDVSTGERLWYVPLAKDTHCAEPDSPACSPRNRAGAIMIPGVLFTGSADALMRAYSTRDGKVLWEFDMNQEFETVNGVPGKGGPHGGPGATVADGMLYVGTGYAILGGGEGNVLLAFGVD